MRLHESPDTYLELIQATADRIGIPAVHVEKDYWVTRVLKRLHESDHKAAVVFKGGTSLARRIVSSNVFPKTSTSPCVAMKD